MNGLDLGHGLRLNPNFTKASLTLVAAAYVTNALPGLALYRSVSGVLVAWPTNFTGWGMVAATNLTSPVFWSPVTVAGTNNTILPLSNSRQFIRLSKPN